MGLVAILGQPIPVAVTPAAVPFHVPDPLGGFIQALIHQAALVPGQPAIPA
jgi:hypothetical protein